MSRRARKEREALLQAAASRSKAADEETREKLQKAKQVRTPCRHAPPWGESSDRTVPHTTGATTCSTGWA